MTGLDPVLMWSGVVLAAVGTVIAALRNIPGLAWDAVIRSATVSVEVRDQDLVKWIGVTAIDKWGLASRRTAAILRTRRERSEVALEPARGKHLLRWRGRFVVIERGKEDSGGGSRDSLQALLAVENVVLRGFGRDPSWLREMLAEATAYGQAKFRELSPVRVMGSYGDWHDLDTGDSRSLDTIILPGTMREDLREAFRVFLSRADWYAARGVPWRLGVGIYGPPGSGKSSLVRAICGEFNLPLHLVDLSGKSITDGTLIRGLGQIGSRAGVLLDDLDASLLPDRDAAPGGITLSGLLGAMDGPGAAEGRVLFVCSNRPERLDPAIIREGRVDITLHLGPATFDQALRLYGLWHPGADRHEAEQFASSGEGSSMANLQGRLLRGAAPLPGEDAGDLRSLQGRDRNAGN